MTAPLGPPARSITPPPAYQRVSPMLIVCPRSPAPSMQSEEYAVSFAEDVYEGITCRTCLTSVCESCSNIAGTCCCTSDPFRRGIAEMCCAWLCSWLR